MEPASVVVEKVQQHQFVIPECREEPWLFDQRQGGERVRPPVDQVSDRQDTVATRVKPESVEFLFELRAVPMEITDDKVAPCRVPRKAKAALEPRDLRHGSLAAEQCLLGIGRGAEGRA